MSRFDGDGNLYALSKHLEEEEKAETALENFTEEVQYLIDEIDERIGKMREAAKTYEGFNMDEETDNILVDLIYPARPNARLMELKRLANEMLEALK